MVFVKLRDWTPEKGFIGVDSFDHEVRLELIPRSEREAPRLARICVTPKDRARAKDLKDLAEILAQKFIDLTGKDRANYYAVFGDYQAEVDSFENLKVLLVPYSVFRLRT